MARKIRIEYAGAAYHVMARGNQGRDIYDDERDRKLWLATLGEACEKTGWRIHAWVMINNQEKNRRLEFELGAWFEGFCGFALVLALSQMMEHGLGPFGRADLLPRRNPLDRQGRFAPQPGSDGPEDEG